ncbi:probable E3 ubiquitin-protein ligase RHY1A isoform X2 [Syzygium oleosum]|uniref:probable E3 ubiquitin-protein ligase RHY1A isoform X2 n=1 Tax=Syzygium oleosum TaxID=219896 RepID=UPI0011D1C59E|nr:probable E3 ubiquitin-protein ligase RHY1A isoform X2 [Syzygium oleosum]
MAGMLPGVECARRRRLHQSGGAWSDPPPTAAYGSVRRCSLSLHSRSHEPHHHSSSSYFRGVMNRGCEDEKLGGVAREAKERLDEKLRTQRIKSECRRSNADGRRTREQEGDTQLRREVVPGNGLKKGGGTKRFSWGKLSWKATDQEECAVCLDSFRAGETLIHLPCTHRFHSRCLVPWLESHSQCPCCRMAVSS